MSAIEYSHYLTVNEYKVPVKWTIFGTVFLYYGHAGYCSKTKVFDCNKIKYDYSAHKILHFVEKLPKFAFLIRQDHCQNSVIMSVSFVKIC